MTQSVRHPSTEQLFREAAQRYLRLKKQRVYAQEAMWAGMLTANFNDVELLLIENYLSENERAWLRQCGRSIPWPSSEDAK